MIETEWHDGIAEIRLARPPVNALDPGLVTELRAGLRARIDAGAGAVVLAGLPGVFSAGLDLPRLLELGRDDLHAFWLDLFGLLEDLASAPVPVVAALSGHSAAGGTLLALFCDHRVMACGDYRVGLNEVRAGLVVPGAIRGALVRLVGRRAAERHLLEGRLLGPDEAHRLGLVDAVVAPGGVVARALEWARERLSLPARAFRENRRLLRADLVGLFADRANVDVDAFTEEWFRDDTQRALRSLVAQFRER